LSCVRGSIRVVINCPRGSLAQLLTSSTGYNILGEQKACVHWTAAEVSQWRVGLVRRLRLATIFRNEVCWNHALPALG
jgi:hypothetical protein